MIELFYTFVFYIISCVFIHSFDSMRNCNVNSQENEKETFNSLYLTGSVEKHLFTRIYFMVLQQIWFAVSTFVQIWFDLFQILTLKHKRRNLHLLQQAWTFWISQGWKLSGCISQDIFAPLTTVCVDPWPMSSFKWWLDICSARIRYSAVLFFTASRRVGLASPGTDALELTGLVSSTALPQRAMMSSLTLHSLKQQVHHAAVAAESSLEVLLLLLLHGGADELAGSVQVVWLDFLGAAAADFPQAAREEQRAAWPADLWVWGWRGGRWGGGKRAAVVQGRQTRAAAAAEACGSPVWLLWGGAAWSHAIVQPSQRVRVHRQRGQVTVTGRTWW